MNEDSASFMIFFHTMNITIYTDNARKTYTVFTPKNYIVKNKNFACIKGSL
jgi:hypothetical protein